MKIDHINISAPKNDLESERKFFCEVFGLKEGFRPSFSNNGYWLYSDKEPLVHLTESNQHFRNKTQGYLDHIAFQMTGIDNLIKKLDELNIPYQTNVLSEVAMTQVFFKSPTGIGLEVNFLDETGELIQT